MKEHEEPGEEKVLSAEPDAVGAEPDAAHGVDEVAPDTSAAGNPVRATVAVVPKAKGVAKSQSTAAVAACKKEAPQPEHDTAVDAERVFANRVTVANAHVRAQSRRRTRRSFVLAAAGAAFGYGFYEFLDRVPQDQMQPGPLRDAFDLNAELSRDVFREHALAPTYPLSRAENLRVNGVYGLKKALKPESWRLQVVGMKDAERHLRYTNDVTVWEYLYTSSENSHQDQGHDNKVDPATLSSAKMAPETMMNKARQDENHTGRKPRGVEEAGESNSTLRPGTPGLLLTMDDMVKLPRHELVTEFKCIEGWSQIVHWAGVRMADFLEAYPPAIFHGKEPRYVYMETPDGDYYTGYDMHVMRHPQTLLVTEMMGAPLAQFHGAPLRLHMPTKYGYKQIKRIGLVAYTNNKPDDYWTRLGYDWYAGL